MIFFFFCYYYFAILFKVPRQPRRVSEKFTKRNNLILLRDRLIFNFKLKYGANGAKVQAQ